MSKKRKLLMGIVGAMICILLVGIGITIICVAKYKEEHRYLTYEELPENQIIFIQSLTEDYEDSYRTHLRAIDASGSVYLCTLYGDYFELNDSTYIKIMDNKTEKDIVALEKVQEMYDKFLNIDSDAELEILSNTYVMDSGTDRYYGILFQEDGDVEYVLLWYDEEYKGQGMLSDTNVRDICKWLANP